MSNNENLLPSSERISNNGDYEQQLLIIFDSIGISGPTEEQRSLAMKILDIEQKKQVLEFNGAQDEAGMILEYLKHKGVEDPTAEDYEIALDAIETLKWESESDGGGRFIDALESLYFKSGVAKELLLGVLGLGDYKIEELEKRLHDGTLRLDYGFARTQLQELQRRAEV